METLDQLYAKMMCCKCGLEIAVIDLSEAADEAIRIVREHAVLKADREYDGAIKAYEDALNASIREEEDRRIAGQGRLYRDIANRYNPSEL